MVRRKEGLGRGLGNRGAAMEWWEEPGRTWSLKPEKSAQSVQRPSEVRGQTVLGQRQVPLPDSTTRQGALRAAEAGPVGTLGREPQSCPGSQGIKADALGTSDLTQALPPGGPCLRGMHRPGFPWPPADTGPPTHTSLNAAGIIWSSGLKPDQALGSSVGPTQPRAV